MNSNVKMEEPSTSFANLEVKREKDASSSHRSEKESTVCICSDVKIKEESVRCSNQKEKENDSNSYSEIRVKNKVDNVVNENEICSSKNETVNMSHSYSEARIKDQEDGTPTSESEKQVEQYDFSLENLPAESKETYDAYISKVKALASIPIVSTISREYIENFKHFNRRYYEDKYCTNFNTNEPGYCDVLIRIHTNKLFLIALASGNDIIRNNRDILYINFVINNNDRSAIQLKGKRKKGSKAVEPQTVLCQIKCANDSRVYNVRAGVYGKIFEINQHIKTNPNLVRLDPKGLGFIAVLTPRGNPDEYEKQIGKLGLLSEEEYFKCLKQRQGALAN